MAIRSNLFAWLLLAPALLFLTLFTFYPIVKTFITSFQQADLATPVPYFNGGGNYLDMTGDPVFWKVMRNTGWFSLGTVPVSIALGLIMAIFANKALKLKGWVRTAFFYPNILPMVAIANIWLFIYAPKFGLLSRVTQWFGNGEINWLGSQNLVMWAVIFVVIWREAGYFMIFYLAGLQNIPTDLYESAAVAGVGSWRVFWRITFPLLMPTTLFVMIVAVTNSFKLVDHLFIMTSGGPDNASNLLLYYIYENAFKYWNQGLASSLTAVMILLLLLLSAVQFFGADKKVHYQ